MCNPATVQQALNQFLDLRHLDTQRRKVCARLKACRTDALGASIYRCTHYEREQRFYHGCRDRHCPQCQSRATRQWVARQHDAILPVAYHHVVFTLPHDLNGWVQLHPEVLYRVLFQSVWRTIRRFGQDPRRLGGRMGMTAVLHTWGQNLSQHVHLHCLIPAGALTDSGDWQAVKGHYLFPVRALSRHFRGAMVSALRACAQAGELRRVTRKGEIDRLLSTLMHTEWVVYSKPCLSHTASVVEYLGRYTHKIAITNARIEAVSEAGVRFRYRDYRDRNRHKTMTLSGPEFVRRYLLHVLPQGFMRIRHFGFLAGCCRARRLAQIRQALQVAEPAAPDLAEPCMRCPVCRIGQLRMIGSWLPSRREVRKTRRR